MPGTVAPPRRIFAPNLFALNLFARPVYNKLMPETTTLTCPKCRSPMEKVEFGRTTVDRCSVCGGLWFDKRDGVAEHEQLAAMTGSESIDTGGLPSAGDVATTPAADIREMQCPRCQGPMVRTEAADHPDLEFEICGEGHGAFFDAGEFKQFKAPGVVAAVKNLWTRVAGD